MTSNLSLITLASAINSEHENCNIAILDGLQHAIKAGELLLQAKELVNHGEWLPWLKSNVTFSERTAQNYMRVFQRKNEILEKSATVADLSYKAAINLLAEPKFPEYEIHELGKIFPYDEGAVNRIFSVMKESGYWETHPITLYEGKILDGKLRYEAARRAGVIPIFEEYNEDDPFEFIKIKNLYRKHLTDDQLAALIAKKEEYATLALDLTKQEEHIKQAAEFAIIAGRSFGEALDTLQAMKEIRDNELYRIEYKTFEEYALDKWGIANITEIMQMFEFEGGQS